MHIFVHMLVTGMLVTLATQAKAIQMEGYFPDALGTRWIYACLDSTGAGNMTYLHVESPQRDFIQEDSRCAGQTKYEVSKGFDYYTVPQLSSRGVNGSGNYSFSPPIPFLPVQTEIGYSHSGSGSVTFTDGTTSVSGTYTTNIGIQANEPVATYGGIFPDAIKVSRVVTMVFRLPDRDVTTGFTETRWFAKGVGEVKQEQDSQLADGTPYHLSLDLFCSSLLGPCSKDEGHKDCDDDCIMAGDPINVATGNSYQEQLDYALPRWSEAVKRRYNSRVAIPTTMGWNWRHGYDHRVEFVGSATPRRALMHRADGKVLVFQEDPGVLVDGQPSWKPEESNVSGRLRAVSTTVVDGRTVPATWRYLAPNDDIEEYDLQGKLTALTDRQGQTLSLDYQERSTSTGPARTATVLTQVRDAFGRALQFNYDTALRLASVAEGSTIVVTYGYDAQNRLVQASYADGDSRRYGYNEPGRIESGSSFPYALTSVTAEDGQLYASWQFDSSGRATLSQLGSGKDRVTVSYGAGSSIVVDPLNMPRTVGHARILGSAKVTSYSAMGTATLRGRDFARGHDANGNVASRIDFNGNLVCSSFDLTRNLETVRVRGLAGTVLCATVTPPGVALPAGSGKLSVLWHPERRRVVQRAEPSKRTHFIYNGQPDPTAGNAIATCAPATALLPDGKPIAVLCKRVEQATTDVDGSKGLSATLQAGVVNRVWAYTYNQHGQLLTAKSPRTDVNETTTYAYYTDTTAEHTMGDLKSVTNAKNQVTQYPLYDKHGQVLRMVDANNVTTDYTYDARQRLKTITVAGQTITMDNLPNGKLQRVTQADGGYIEYEYDDAQRQVAIRDHLSNRIEYTLDNAGNQTAEKVNDPLGALRRQMTQAMDALGRVQKTTEGQ